MIFHVTFFHDLKNLFCMYYKIWEVSSHTPHAVQGKSFHFSSRSQIMSFFLISHFIRLIWQFTVTQKLTCVRAKTNTSFVLYEIVCIPITFYPVYIIILEDWIGQNEDIDMLGYVMKLK